MKSDLITVNSITCGCYRYVSALRVYSTRNFGCFINRVDNVNCPPFMDSEIYGQWQLYQGRVQEKKILTEIWRLCWEAVDSAIFIVPGYGKKKQRSLTFYKNVTKNIGSILEFLSSRSSISALSTPIIKPNICVQLPHRHSTTVLQKLPPLFDKG